MQGFLLAVTLAAASSPADTSGTTAAPAANPPAAAAPINREEARRAFKEGDEAFKAGNYEVALNHFLKSYELSHLGELLYDIAQCYRLLSRWSEAEIYYQRYLMEFPNGKSHDQAAAQLLEVRQKLAELEAAKPKQANLHAPPQEPTNQVTATGGESHPTPLAIGLGTVGVVASVVAVVGLVEVLTFSHPSTPQPVSQVQASVDSANTWATVALISGIVGVAGITGGILTW